MGVDGQEARVNIEETGDRTADFVAADKTTGFVPEFKKSFLEFHENHSDDIEGSAFKELLDQKYIQTLLKGG